METSKDDVVFKLEKILTPLVKAVIREKPLDIEKYCGKYFTSGTGARENFEHAHDRKSNADGGLSGAQLVKELSLRQEKGLPLLEYEEDDFQSNDGSEGNSESDAVLQTLESNVTEVGVGVLKMKSIDFPSKKETERFNKCIEEAAKDSRTRRLFENYDRDNSGTIDVEELALELRKFEEIEKEGTGVRLASEAMIHFDDSGDKELQFEEFVKVIVRFCHQIRGTSYVDIADRLLLVSEYSSERAANGAAQGDDISEIRREDEENEEFVRDTFVGIRDAVNRNIAKMREGILSPRAQ